MNKSLVFKNTKGYDLFVTTPNGAGRRLPSGKCVSGSFYIHSANMGQLTRVPEHLVREDEILWNAEISGYQYKETTPVPAPEPPPVAPVAPSEPVAEAPVDSPVPVTEAAVEAPVAEEAPLSPGDRELYKMGMEELKMIAATKGVDFPVDIKKKKLIALINSAK